MGKILSAKENCSRVLGYVFCLLAILFCALSQCSSSCLGSDPNHESGASSYGYRTGVEYRDDGGFYLELTSGWDYADACDNGDGTFYVSVSNHGGGSFMVFHFYPDGVFDYTSHIIPNMGYSINKCMIGSILRDESGWIVSGIEGWVDHSHYPPHSGWVAFTSAFDMSQTMLWSKIQSVQSDLIEPILVRTADDTVFYCGNETSEGSRRKLQITRYGPDWIQEFGKKIYVNRYNTTCTSLCPTSDDGVLVAGLVEGSGFLIKLSATLDVEEYSGISNTLIYAVYQCEDGKILLTACSSGYMLIVQLDEQQNLIWARRISGALPVSGGILPYDSNSFVVAASGNGMNVVKMSYDGSLYRVYNFTSGNHTEICMSFIRTNENKFVLCGLNAELDRVVVVQTDADFMIPSCPAITEVTLDCQPVSITMTVPEITDWPSIDRVGLGFTTASSSVGAHYICNNVSSPTPTHPPYTATATNTPNNDITPTPTMTVTPSQTPVSCDVSGVTLWMPAHEFQTGDVCSCSVRVCIAEPDAVIEYPLFVILSLYGEYYYAPSFNDFDHYLGMYNEFPPGETIVDVLPQFIWPANTGRGDNCIWYSALVNPEMTSIFGEMDSWPFQWFE